MAASIQDLSKASRKARTAMWCSLMVTLLKNLTTSDSKETDSPQNQVDVLAPIVTDGSLNNSSNPSTSSSSNNNNKHCDTTTTTTTTATENETTNTNQ